MSKNKEVTVLRVRMEEDYEKSCFSREFLVYFFSEKGNLLPIVEEIQTNLCPVKTFVCPKILLDYREADRLVWMSLFVGIGEGSLEDAVHILSIKELREKADYLVTKGLLELEAVEDYVYGDSEDPEWWLKKFIYSESGRTCGPEYITKIFKDCLERYSEEFSIPIPFELVQDVKRGTFEARKWATMATALGINYSSHFGSTETDLESGSSVIDVDEVDTRDMLEQYFLLTWTFGTKNGSFITYKLNIEPRMNGMFSICISIAENDDYFLGEEQILFRPSFGKSVNINHVYSWKEYDESSDDIKEGSVLIYSKNPVTQSVSHFARIFL